MIVEDLRVIACSGDPDSGVTIVSDDATPNDGRDACNLYGRTFLSCANGPSLVGEIFASGFPMCLEFVSIELPSSGDGQAIENGSFSNYDRRSLPRRIDDRFLGSFVSRFPGFIIAQAAYRDSGRDDEWARILSRSDKDRVSRGARLDGGSDRGEFIRHFFLGRPRIRREKETENPALHLLIQSVLDGKSERKSLSSAGIQWNRESQSRPESVNSGMNWRYLATIMTLAATTWTQGEIVEKAIEYESEGVTCEGWHVYDDGHEGGRPSVLIVHQWTGLTDYEKMRARMLAELGYNVFALDIYGKGIRPQPPESGKVSGKFKADRELFRKRLRDGLAVLKDLPQTSTEKIAAIGYCFGGTGVLELARSGADIAGVVSFHGGLGTPTPEDAKNITSEVMVLHGAVDPYVPVDEVAAFHKEMLDANVAYTFTAYPDAVHAFTQKMAGDDPSKGAAYQAEADAASWEAMKTFFGRIFE